MIRFSLKLLSLMLLSCRLLSCRKWPDNPQPVDAQLQGFYIGRANIGGGFTNVLVEVLTADSLGNLKGSIIYRADTSAFTQIYTNSARDSLWFRYVRASVSYQATASVTALSMTANFSTPTGIPAFRMNKELNTYNMSGLWTGLMSSAIYQNNSYNAELTMDQTGSLYTGTIVVSFPQSQTILLSGGSSNQNSFQISGTIGSTSNGPAVLFSGVYVTTDHISGSWYAENSSDQGQFVFLRAF